MKRPEFRRPRWLRGKAEREPEAEPAPEGVPPPEDSSSSEPEPEPEPGEPDEGVVARLRARARRLGAAVQGDRGEAETAAREPGADDERPEEPVDQREEAATGIGFRASTRVRAAGYWARERAQAAGKLATAAWNRVSEFWDSRSERGRIQIAAGVGVVLLYALLRFTALPGVPCSISATKSCSPGDDTVALVPADSLLYAHVTLDGDTEQSERAAEVFDQLSELERVLVGGASAAVGPPSGAAIDLRADVLAWARDDLAVAVVPGAQPKDSASQAFLMGVGDRDGADAFIAKVAPGGAAPQTEEQGDGELDVYPGGFATAFVDDQLAFGGEPAVRAILDTASNGRPELEDSTEAEARDGLSESRFADVYLSRAGVKELLEGRVGPAAQLETFVDYGATSGFAAGLVAADDGLEIELISLLDPELAERSPSFFSSLPEFEPDLAGEVGADAIGYIGVGELGTAVTEVLGQAGPQAGGLAGSLRALAAELETEAGVNPLQDLLPALGGQAALLAQPTASRPFASLIVEDVDEEEAGKALARLQRPLLRAAGSGAEGGTVPRFIETEVDGTIVRSVELSPVVNLSYALFDGNLVVEHEPAGCRAGALGRRRAR